MRYQQIGKATSKENKGDNSSSSTMVPPPEHPSASEKETAVPLKVRENHECLVFQNCDVSSETYH